MYIFFNNTVKNEARVMRGGLMYVYTCTGIQKHTRMLTVKHKKWFMSASRKRGTRMLAGIEAVNKGQI